MDETLRLELLGGLRITRGGVPLTAFHSNKVPALLAYLAVTGRPHFRTALAALLWSEQSEEDARRNLRVVLSNLRHFVAPHVVITRETIAFDRTSAYCLDVEQFEAAVHDVQLRDVNRLQAAVDLYHGDFLDGFYVRDAPVFDEWATAQRERLRQLTLHALHELVCHHRTQRADAAGIDACTRLLALDPWREETHRHLMELLARSGQRSAALAQYGICRRVLDAELGVEPSEETTALYQRILAGVLADEEPAPPEFALSSAADTPGTPRHTLPTPPTPLVGRATELAQIAAYLVNPRYRLLTLIGPGGVGKTRLALEVAAQQGNFDDGVYFVKLAPLRDPALLAATIAQTLRLRETIDQPALEGLKAWLRDRTVLLVLDNCEHLLAAAPLVSDLLASCPRLKVLGTSRAALHLRGEQVFPVSPLSVPNPPHLLPAALDATAGPTRYAAVELFVLRAKATRPDFQLTCTNASAVAEICVRLDGLPLAIELAAARINVLSPAALLGRLDKRFEVLTAGTRDGDARQRTLRAAIDWSHHLLTPDEQVLFARLAVFVGGCSLSAAEAVCTALDDLHIDVLDGLTTLIDNSLLLKQDSDGEPRFHMLETLREYALEHLVAQPTHEQIRQAHAVYYVTLAEAAGPQYHEPETTGMGKELARDQQNIRAALAWLLRPVPTRDISRAQGELALRLAAALGHVWAIWGDWQDGRRWLNLVLEQAGPSTSPARARVCFIAGWLARLQDDPTGQPLLEESVTHFQNLGDTAGSAWALYALGLLWRDAGRDLAKARAYLAESLAHFRVLHDPRGTTEALGALIELALAHEEIDEATRLCEAQLSEAGRQTDRAGVALAHAWLGRIALFSEDYAAATAHGMASLASYRRLNDQAGVNHALYVLGCAALQEGDVKGARHYFEEKLAATRAAGDQQQIAFALDDLARAVFREGATDRAYRLIVESITLLKELGDQRSVAHRVAGLVELAHAQGRLVPAIHLAALVDRLLAESGTTLTPPYLRTYADVLASARGQLAAAEFEATWAEGHAMPLEQAVAYALEGTLGD